MGTRSDNTLSDVLRRELLAGRVGADDPGAVIAVYRDGDLIASACAGVADTDTGEALTERSLMNIASVSKQIVAATVLLAAQRGEVDLDADLRTLVPEVRLEGVTLRRCLNHTAGLPDYFSASMVADIPIIEIAGLDVFLDWLRTVEEGDFAPGSNQAYSNTGYVSAALAVERATGRVFPDLIAETVFRPLGMDETFVTTVLGEFVPGMAMSFTKSDSGFTRETMGVGEVDPVRGVNGDGEVITNLAEFGRWHGFLRDGRVLGEEIRLQLLERAVLADGRVSDYALGIMHQTQGDVVVQAHAGGMWGFRAYSLVDQESGLSVACFTNRSDLAASELAFRALRLARGGVGVSGRWFSFDQSETLELVLLGNGDLSATAGPGAPESRLLRTGGGTTWRAADGSLGVDLRDGALFATNWYGFGDRYRRLAPPRAVPDGVLGQYREPIRGRVYRFEERDGALWAIAPGGAEERVEPWGETADVWIGATPAGWLLVDVAPFGRVRLALGTFSVTLRPHDE